MYTCYKYFYIHVMLLKTIYWMSSHQNLSVRLISILLFSKLLSFAYCLCQYLLQETKICFIVSARCTNTGTMDHFLKLAKFPGLHKICLSGVMEIQTSSDLRFYSNLFAFLPMKWKSFGTSERTATYRPSW